MNKEKVYAAVMQQLEARLAQLAGSIASVKEARNNESKSSAGDKYETGREMMQSELDKLLSQESLLLKQQHELSKISPTRQHKDVSLGSLVRTDQATYFLSTAFGVVEGVYVISLASPIGSLLLNKSVGDSIAFRGKQQQIMEVQ